MVDTANRCSTACYSVFTACLQSLLPICVRAHVVLKMIHTSHGKGPIRHIERKLYNTQLNVQRAIAAIAKIANMALEADQSSKMIDSKALLRAALDGVTVLGQTQASLTNSRKNYVKQILSDDVKDICNPKRKASQYLFGDDLTKSIKEARDIYRMSNNIGNKKPQSKHPSTRGSHTATRPNNNAPRNGQGHFLDRGRGANRSKRNLPYRKQT